MPDSSNRSKWQDEAVVISRKMSSKMNEKYGDHSRSFDPSGYSNRNISPTKTAHYDRKALFFSKIPESGYLRLWPCRMTEKLNSQFIVENFHAAYPLV